VGNTVCCALGGGGEGNIDTEGLLNMVELSVKRKKKDVETYTEGLVDRVFGLWDSNHGQRELGGSKKKTLLFRSLLGGEPCFVGCNPFPLETLKKSSKKNMGQKAERHCFVVKRGKITCSSSTKARGWAEGGRQVGHEKISSKGNQKETGQRVLAPGRLTPRSAGDRKKESKRD